MDGNRALFSHENQKVDDETSDYYEAKHFSQEQKYSHYCRKDKSKSHD